MNRCRRKKAWWVYILRCEDDTLYCGATNDLSSRIAAHNRGAGAKYTRGRGPVTLAFAKKIGSKSATMKREAWIKRLPRNAKLKLIKTAKRKRTKIDA